MAVTIGKRLKPPGTTLNISHYTTLDGLVGIIDSGHIWASNVSFLNDRRELQHGVDASLEAIKAFTKKAAFKEWHSALKHAASALEKGVIPNTYAACFCEQSDVLSQWRGYGGSQQGVSIAFSRKELTLLMKRSKAALHPVIYGNISTTTKMSAALKAVLDDLRDFEETLGETSSDEKNKAAHRAICRLLPQFKHYGFRDERELRYVVQQETVRDSVCFRAAGNVLVPYLKLLPGSPTKLPIRSVTVGPGRDQILTQRSIRLYLEKRGYTEAEVKLSQVPFRT